MTNTSKSVLLVMDVQNRIVEMMGNNEGYLNDLEQAVAAARKANIPVMYVVLGFREGLPEISPTNKRFETLKSSGFAFTASDPGTAIHPKVSPQAHDYIITKKRVSAFAGSDLEIMLRVMKIEHLILTGLATSGVVLSTLREAADKDFKITVLSNACGDRDEEVHHVLVNKIFPAQAEVLTTEAWAAGLNK